MSLLNPSKILVIVLLVIGSIVGSAPADAYRMICNTSVGRVTQGLSVTCNASEGFAHWTERNITWKVNLGGQSSGFVASLTSAMSSWSSVHGSTFQLNYGGTTSAGWSTDNVNTVIWASGNGCSGSCLALTALVLQSGQKIVESDITFNSAYSWYTNGLNYDVEAVAAHEFGHSLGIHHSDSSCGPPTMKTPYFGINGRSLEDDDEDALRCVESRYPPAPPLSVYITRSGGTFTAHASGGSSPYSYTWYRLPLCGGDSGGEPLPSTGGSGGLPTKDIPCGGWSNPSSTNPAHIWSPYGSDQDIKVVVTDSEGVSRTALSYEP